jgi:hypothetical protein
MGIQHHDEDSATPDKGNVEMPAESAGGPQSLISPNTNLKRHRSAQAGSKIG